MTEDVKEAESAPESPVKEPQDIVEEAIVNEGVTEAQAAPESPVKEEHEAVLEEVVVIEEVTEAETHWDQQSKKNLRMLWKKQL